MRYKSSYFVLIFITSLFPLKSGASVISAILNGTVTSLSVIPYQVKLTITKTSGSSSESILCGGSIIDDSVVLTAAHCLEEDDGYSTSTITIQYLDYTDSSSPSLTSATTADFELSPDWTGSLTNSNDIAVIYAPNAFTNAKKIKVASETEITAMLAEFATSYTEGQDNDTNVQASGYGIDENDEYDVLKRVLLTGIPSSTCTSLKASSGSDDDVICVQSPSQSTDYGICSGDSGGPLVWQNPSNSSDSDYGVRLIGVASYVTADNGSCRMYGTGYYGAYTNITYFKDVVNDLVNTLAGTSDYDYENLSISYSFDSNPILASNSTTTSSSSSSSSNTTVTTTSGGGGSIGFLTLIILVCIRFFRLQPQ